MSLAHKNITSTASRSGETVKQKMSRTIALLVQPTESLDRVEISNLLYKHFTSQVEYRKKAAGLKSKLQPEMFAIYRLN